MTTITAADHIDPDHLIVKSGELLARRAIESLQHGESAVISLKGMAGISSSYFNMFLRTVTDVLGIDALQRVRFDFVSPLQRQVYERSLEAILNVSTPQTR